MKKGKKLFSYILIALSAVFCIGSLNLSPKSRVSALGNDIYKTFNISNLAVGDTIEFGEYPQSYLGTKVGNILDSVDEQGYHAYNGDGDTFNGVKLNKGDKVYALNLGTSLDEKYPYERYSNTGDPVDGNTIFGNAKLDPRRWYDDHPDKGITKTWIFNSVEKDTQTIERTSRDIGRTNKKDYNSKTTTYYFKVEPLKWYVQNIAANGNVTLICTSVIDAMNFNLYDSNGNMWATSYIRNWLNGTDGGDTNKQLPVLYGKDNTAEGNLTRFASGDDRGFIDWYDYDKSTENADGVWFKENDGHGWDWLFIKFNRRNWALSDSGSRNSVLRRYNTIANSVLDSNGGHSFVSRAFNSEEYNLLQDQANTSQGNNPTKNYLKDGLVEMTAVDKVKLVYADYLGEYKIITGSTSFATANGFIKSFDSHIECDSGKRSEGTGSGFGYIWTSNPTDVGKQYTGYQVAHNLRDVAQINFGNNAVTKISAKNDKTGKQTAQSNGVNSMDQSYGIVPQIVIKLDNATQYLVGTRTISVGTEVSNGAPSEGEKNFKLGSYISNVSDASVSFDTVQRVAKTNGMNEYTIKGKVTDNSADKNIIKNYYLRISDSENLDDGGKDLFSTGRTIKSVYTIIPDNGEFEVKLTSSKTPQDFNVQPYFVSADASITQRAKGDGWTWNNSKNKQLDSLRRTIYLYNLEKENDNVDIGIDGNNLTNVKADKLVGTRYFFKGENVVLDDLSGASTTKNYWFAGTNIGEDNFQTSARINAANFINDSTYMTGALVTEAGEPITEIKYETDGNNAAIYPGDNNPIYLFRASSKLKYALNWDAGNTQGHYYFIDGLRNEAHYPKANTVISLDPERGCDNSIYTFKLYIKYPYIKQYSGIDLATIAGMVKVTVGGTEATTITKTVTAKNDVKFNDGEANKEICYDIQLTGFSEALASKKAVISFNELKTVTGNNISQDTYKFSMNYGDEDDKNVTLKNESNLQNVSYGSSQKAELGFNTGYYLKSGWTPNLNREQTTSDDKYGYLVPEMRFTYAGLVRDGNGYRYADTTKTYAVGEDNKYAGQRIRIDNTGRGITFDGKGNLKYSAMVNGNAVESTSDKKDYLGYYYFKSSNNYFIPTYTFSLDFKTNPNNHAETIAFDLTETALKYINKEDTTEYDDKSYFQTNVNSKIYRLRILDGDKVELILPDEQGNAGVGVTLRVSTDETNIATLDKNLSTEMTFSVTASYKIAGYSDSANKYVLDNNDNPTVIIYQKSLGYYADSVSNYRLTPAAYGDEYYKPWVEHISNSAIWYGGELINSGTAIERKFVTLDPSKENESQIVTFSTGRSTNAKYWNGNKVWFITNGTETLQITSFENGMPKINNIPYNLGLVDGFAESNLCVIKGEQYRPYDGWLLFAIDGIDVNIGYNVSTNAVTIDYTLGFVASDVEMYFHGVQAYDYEINFQYKLNNDSTIIAGKKTVAQGGQLNDIEFVKSMTAKSALLSDVDALTNIKTFVYGDVTTTLDGKNDSESNVTIFVPLVPSNKTISYYMIPSTFSTADNKITKTYKAVIGAQTREVWKVVNSSNADEYVYILRPIDGSSLRFVGSSALEIKGYFPSWNENTKVTTTLNGTTYTVKCDSTNIKFTDAADENNVITYSYLTAELISGFTYEFSTTNTSVSFNAVYGVCDVNISIKGWENGEDNYYDLLERNKAEFVGVDKIAKEIKADESESGKASYYLKDVKFNELFNEDLRNIVNKDISVSTISKKAFNNENTKRYVNDTSITKTGLIGYFRKTAYEANDNIISQVGSGYKVNTGLEMQYINGQAMYYKQTPDGSIEKYYAVKVNSEGYVENIYTYKLVDADTKFMRTNVELYTLFGINHYEVVATVVGDTQSAAIEQASVPQDLMIGTLTGTNVEISYKMRRSYTQSVPLISVKDGKGDYLQIGNLNGNDYTAVIVDENGKVDFGVDGDYVVEYIESANVYKVIIDAQKFTSNLTASLGSVNNGKIEGNGQEFVINKYNVSFTVPAESDTNMDGIGDFKYCEGEVNGTGVVDHNGQATLTFKLGEAYDYKKLQFAIWASKDTTVDGSQLEPENVVNIVSLDSLQGGSGSTKISVNDETISITINYDATEGTYSFEIKSVTHAVSVHLEKIDSSSNALKTFTYTVDYDHNIKGSDANNLAYTVYKSAVETNGAGEINTKKYTLDYNTGLIYTIDVAEGYSQSTPMFVLSGNGVVRYFVPVWLFGEQNTTITLLGENCDITYNSGVYTYIHSGMTYAVSCVKGAAATETKPAEPDKWTYTVTSGTNVETYIVKIGQNRQYSFTMNAEKDWKNLYAAVYRLVDTDKTTITTGKEKNPNIYQQSFKENSFDDTKITATIPNGNVEYGSTNEITYTVKGGYSHNLPVITINDVPYYIPNMGDRNVFGETNESYGLVKESSNKWTYEYKVGEEVKATYYVTASTSAGQYVFNYYTTINEINVKILTLTIDVKNKENTVVSTDTKYVTAADGTTVVVTSKDRFQGDITYTYSVLQFYTDNIELSEAENNKNTFAENKYLVVLSKRVLEGITGNSFKYKDQGDMKDASDNTFVIIVGKDKTNGYRFNDPLETNTEITKQEGYYYNSYVWTVAGSTQSTVIKDLTLIRKLGEALTHLPKENSTWESEGVTYKYYENEGVIDKTILAVEQNGVTTNKYKFTKQWGSSVSDNNGVSFNNSGLTSSEITGHIQLFATFCENAYRVKVGNLPTATGTYAKFGALFTTIKGGTSVEASSATSELMSFTKTKNLTLSYRVYAAYDQTEPVFNLVGLYGDIVLLMPKTIGYEDAAVTYQYQKQDGVAYTVTVIRDASNSNKYTYSVTANGKEVSFTLTITKSNINRVGASQISINYQIVFNNEFMGLNNADEVVVNIYPATHYEENDAVVKNINEVSNTNSAYNVSNIENNLTLNRYAINYYDMLLENKAVISKTAFGNNDLFDGILELYNNINNTEATVGSIELTKVTVSGKKYIICQNGGTTTYYTNVTAVGLNELIPGKNIDATYENTNFDTTTFYITGKTGTKKIVHGENYVDQVKATSINAVRGYDSMNGTNYCWSDGKNEITTSSANLYDNMVVYPVYKEKGVTVNFGSTVYLIGDNTLDFNQSPNQFAKVSGPSTSTPVKFTQERTFTVTVNEIYSKTEIDFSIAGDSNAIVKVSYVDNSTANGMQKVYTVKVSYVYSTESLLLKISAKNAKITTNNYQVILITPTKFEYATQAGVKEAGASIAAEILGETNSVRIAHGSKVSTTDAANSALLSKSNGISLEGWTFAGWYVPRNWSQYADIVNKYLNENKDSILDSTLFNNIKDGFGTITTNTSTTGYSRFAALGTNALVYTGETAITHDTILIAGFTRNQIQVKIYNTVQENDYFGFIDKASNIVNKDALTQGSDYLVKTIPYGTFIASPYDEMTNARIVPATEAFTRNTTENEYFYLDDKGESTTFTPTSKIIKEDIEIYVGYTRKAFTINFEYKDSSGSTQRITIENVKYGTKISEIQNDELKTIIDPETKKLINKSAPETGKHFVRWIYQTTIVDENYVVTRTATFSEVFDYNQFKISFDTTNIDSIVYNVGDTVGSANINEVQWVDNKLVLGYNKALVLALNPSIGYGKGGNYTAKLTFNGNKVDLDDNKLIIGNDGTITIMQGVLGNSEYVDGAEFTLVIEANINNYSVTIAGDNSIVCEGKTYNKDGNAWFYQDDNTNSVIKITAANADYNTDFIMTVSVFRSYNQKSVFVFKVYNGNNSEDYRIVTVDNSNLMTLSEDHNRFIGIINLGVATDDLTVELVSKIDDKETKIINNDYYIKFVVKIGNDKNGWKEELLTGTGYVGIMASEGNNHKIEKAIIPSASDLSVERTTDPSWCEMISNGWLMKKGGGVFTAEEWNAIDWTNMNTILESAYIGDATTSIEFTKDTTLYIVYMIKTIDVEVAPVSDDVKTKGSFSAPETANKRDPEAKTTVGFGEYTFTYTVGVKYSKNIPVIDIGGKKLVILPYIVYSGMNIGAQYQKEALYNDATAKFIVEKTESGYKYWQVGAESNQTTVNYNGGKYVFSGMDISVVPNDNQYTITLSNPQGAEDNKMTLSSNAATYEVNEYKVTYKLPDGTQKVETVKYEGSLVSVPEIKADFFHKITYTITYADGKTEKVSLKTLREIQFTSDATVTIKNEANVVVIILVAAAGVAVLAIVIISIVKAAGNAKYRSKASKENSEMFKKLSEQQQKQNKDNNGENGPKI